MRNLLTALALTCPAVAQDLLVVESNFKTVLRVSGVDGSVLDPVFLNLNLSTGTAPVLPVQAVQVGQEVWVADREADTVFRFRMDGTYMTESAGGCDDLGGLSCWKGKVWITNAGAGGAGYGAKLLEYTPVGGLTGKHSTGSVIHPYGVVAFYEQFLVSDPENDTIGRLASDGALLTPFLESDGATDVHSPRQISLRPSNGNVLVAGHDAPSGIYEYDASGAQVAFFDTGSLGFGGVEGVRELANGNLLFTNADGLHVYETATDTVQTVYGGFVCWAISRLDPEEATPVHTVVLDSSGDGEDNPASALIRVATDEGGNAYALGSFSHNGFRIGAGGYVSLLIDENGDGNGHELGAPNGVATDPLGNVYVCAMSSETAFRIRPDGQVQVLIDATGDQQGHVLTGANDVATDQAGNAYVSGYTSDNVFRITPAGQRTQIIGPDGDGNGHALDGASYLCTDTHGNVYVSGHRSDNVFRVAPDGAIEQVLDSSGDGFGNFVDEPGGLVYDDATESLYVNAWASHGVFRVSEGGTVTLVTKLLVGNTGEYLTYPRGGLALDPRGGIVACGDHPPIFRIAPDGEGRIVTRGGDVGGVDMGFASDLAVDPDGSVFAATFLYVFKVGEPVNAGTNYCGPAEQNSRDLAARITAKGSTVVADQTLELAAWDLPFQQYGYFLASQTAGFIAHPGGSQGNLCLGGKIGRFVADLQNSGSTGSFAIEVDLSNMPPPAQQVVLPGETWNFQAWFRDKNPDTTSNFTNGVSVTYQ